MTTTTANRPQFIVFDQMTSQARSVGAEVRELGVFERIMYVLLLIAAVAVSAVVAVGVALVATVLIAAGVAVRLAAALFRTITGR